MKYDYDVIVIGAGAAGLFCSIEAGKRKRKTLVLDHSNKIGKKILMSGGGKCNFTNTFASYENYLSNNPHFVKSALKRFTPWDFVELVEKYNIPYYEKTVGQLFCKNKAKDIVEMLLSECQLANVTIKINTSTSSISKSKKCFIVETKDSRLTCRSLVIATGGLSIPTMGATGFGYNIAKQFHINVLPTRAALVPFTLHNHDKETLSKLSGLSTNTKISCENHTYFNDDILFTHRGLSGPAILQISTYWKPGEGIDINFTPNVDLYEEFNKKLMEKPNSEFKTFLSQFIPKKLLATLIPDQYQELKLNSITNSQLSNIVYKIENYKIKPNGTEGYRTAELTQGGIDCDEISSKTMECLKVKDLYFVGEVLDVNGWLGGYNFQWAWSSGWAAGQYV